MPCSDGGYAPGNSPYERLDKVTAMLCSICGVFHGTENWPHVPLDVQIWYLDHVEADKLRIEKNKKDNQMDLKRLRQEVSEKQEQIRRFEEENRRNPTKP